MIDDGAWKSRLAGYSIKSKNVLICNLSIKNPLSG